MMKSDLVLVLAARPRLGPVLPLGMVRDPRMIRQALRRIQADQREEAGIRPQLGMGPVKDGTESE